MNEEKSFHERVAEVQQKLKAPKGQVNSFGKYNYRSCEDILEAVKPHLNGLVLTITDDIVEVAGRVYVKAVANITDGINTGFTVSAFAREPEQKKGMDSSQVTGAASSYARKYALNGLFLIDDTKDSDTMDNTLEGEKVPSHGPLNNNAPSENMKKKLWALLYKKYKGQKIPKEQADFVEKSTGQQCSKAIDKLEAELDG